MIVKMRKYSFLVYHQIYLDFLDKIREVGVLHVIEKAEGVSEDESLNHQMQLSSKLKSLLRQLQSELQDDDTLKANSASVDCNRLMEHIEAQYALLESLTQKLQAAERERERMEVWGKFSVERLEKLQEAGFELKFFNCNIRKFDAEWETLYNAFEIDTIGTQLYFVTINKLDVEVNIDADPVKLSDKSADEIRLEINSIHEEIATEKADIRDFAIKHYNDLQVYSEKVSGEIDFSKVVLNTRSEVDNKVMLLEGFCPEPVEAELNAMLDASGVYYEVSNPEIEEQIPIKLNNSRFSKLFEPITELFSLPNYSELDPTPFLAPFFMLFFGLCLGDGGYGLLIWLAATLLKPKMQENMKGLLTLGQYLGLATLAVGILTGSVFGIALDQVEWKWLSGVKQYFITEGNYAEKLGGYNPMMLFAVVIGVIQILFGMLVKVMKVNKQHGFKHAVGHLAWVVFIAGMIVYVALQSFGVILPIIGMYVLYGIIGLSVVIILFYNSPGKNIFLNFGSALWNTYNMATGLLGDTLSYIRLFALGLTGSILGGVFNTLAFDLTSGVNPFARWLVVLLILLVGHSINFALCLIGAFVHPIRLTFVEFYKNAGFEGGGKAYKPFQVKK